MAAAQGSSAAGAHLLRNDHAAQQPHSGQRLPTTRCRSRMLCLRGSRACRASSARVGTVERRAAVTASAEESTSLNGGNNAYAEGPREPTVAAGDLTAIFEQLEARRQELESVEQLIESTKQDAQKLRYATHTSQPVHLFTIGNTRGGQVFLYLVEVCCWTLGPKCTQN